VGTDRPADRLQRALSAWPPEAAPRLLVAALRDAFPGTRVDLVVRRRRGERRSWAPVAWRPASEPVLEVREDEVGTLPARAQRRDEPVQPPLPGEASLWAAGRPHRLVVPLRSAELRAFVSLASERPFRAQDHVRAERLSRTALPVLSTWARLLRFRIALRRARFLQRLMADVNRGLEPGSIARAAARRLREVLPLQRAVLVVAAEDAREVTAFELSADEGFATVRVTRHPGRAVTKARLGELGEPQIVADLATLPARDAWQEEALAASCRSLAVLPLVTRRQVVAALLLGAREPGALGAEHLGVLRPLARSLASALEKARLFSEAAVRTRRMTALYEVGQALSAPVDTEGVTERVLSALHEAFRFRHSAVLTLESQEGADWLVMQASRGYLRQGEGFRMPVGERGITSRAVRTGRLVYVPDVRQDPSYVQGVESGRSEVAVPLVAGGRVVGVLDVESEELNAFSVEDLETLKLFSTQVALALERARLFEDVRRQAMTDALSGLMNQRSFKQKVERELDRSRRTRRPFVLALIDVDDFKSINDAHGHGAGDQVISAIGEALRGRMRSIDAAARVGGDEFAVILPETDLQSGLRVVDDVRAELLQHRPAGIAVGLSVGVAEWHAGLSTQAGVMHAADQALYRAKSLGKGRAVTAEPPAG